MNINSEKEMYGSRLHEEVANFNAEYFVWGEELIDKKLILYSKKLKQIPGYDEIKDVLEPCGLVIVNVSKKKYLHCTSAMLDTERGNLYMSEANFNSIWGYLKRSVGLGIRIAQQEGESCPVQNPEEIVVLDYLVREGSHPVIEDNVIKYQHRELTNEEKQLYGRRQSLLDNPRMLYYFSETGRYYHDKDCESVKEILPEQFHASETMPEDKEICPKCRRLIYFRKATYPNAKQSGICNRIFLNRQVPNSMISHCIMDLGMKFHATTLDEMQVEYGEDTWIIKGLDTDMLSLWHNNYVKTSETERYITEGFHNQNVDRKKLVQILKYIEGYSWQKHLANENRKVIEEAVEPTTEERVEHLEMSPVSVATSEKRAWYQVLAGWFCNLFKRFK
jgi:ssDNA-binding Zn-finger/Zn-ribbon topoisomerase 1